MNEQDKQLLFKDLCARLPYNVIIRINHLSSEEYNSYLYGQHLIEFQAHEIRIKPYLRPMESMTEDEKKEYRKTQYKEVVVQYPCTAAPNDVEIWCSTASTYDYLNSIHVDYRGLIEKGLALPAPEGMYDLKNNR